MQEEMVRFRLLELPCCHMRLLWIEQALPQFCSNCGHNLDPRVCGLTIETMLDDPHATLTYEGE